MLSQPIWLYISSSLYVLVGSGQSCFHPLFFISTKEGTLSATFPPPPLYEFVAVASENNQYLPPLVLLLRAIEFRRERDDLEAAVVFRLAVNSHILPQGTQQQQQQGSPTNGGPLWRRSLLRWIRGVVEHEMVVEDLNAINGRECPSSSIEQTDEMELMSRCKAILTSTDIGPEAVISDDLLTSAACYVLCKVSSFYFIISYFSLYGLLAPKRSGTLDHKSIVT